MLSREQAPPALEHTQLLPSLASGHALLADSSSQSVHEFHRKPPASVGDRRRAVLCLRDLLRIVEQRHNAARLSGRARLEMNWLSTHREQYGGRWVALIGDRLLAVDDSAR